MEVMDDEWNGKTVQEQSVSDDLDVVMLDSQ
jgi:hypothetical protein